jgi:hypothetical protein
MLNHDIIIQNAKFLTRQYHEHRECFPDDKEESGQEIFTAAFYVAFKLDAMLRTTLDEFEQQKDHLNSALTFLSKSK